MRKALLTLLLCFLPFTVFATDNEPVNTLPSLSPSASSYGTQRTYLQNELPDILGRYFNRGWVYSGGIHATAGGMTSSAFSTEAFTSSGNRVTTDGAGGAAAVNYSNVGCAANDTAWVIISGASGNTLSNFTRVSGTNIFVNCIDATQPTLPSDSTWLMQVTISGSAITAVSDLRNGYVIPTYETAVLPGTGIPGQLIRRRDGVRDYLRWSGTQWVSLSYGAADVRMFGATGDCSTDDAAAFTAAMAAAKNVVVPDPPGGCYKIGSTLTIPSNVWLVGVNKRTTKIQHAANAALFSMGDGAGLFNLYLEGDGDNYSGVALAYGGTNGRQVVQHMRIVNFRDNCVDFFQTAGSQSVMTDVELNSWDVGTHAAAATGSGKFAIVIDTTAMLTAVPRKFHQLETNGSPAIHFGGSNDTYLSDSFVGDLGFSPDSRGVHISGIRLANQSALNLDGHNNTLVNSGIAPALTIVSGSDDWHITGNSLNQLPIVDNSGNGRNVIEHLPVTYTPTWTATAGAAPSLGNGTLRGQYTRTGNLIHLSVELIGGATTTWGNAGVWNFALPATYIGGLSPAVQIQSGSGYARDDSTGTVALVVPTVTNGTSVAVVRIVGTGGDMTYNQPWTWAQNDLVRFTLTYSVR